VGFWKNAILLTKRARDQRLARCPRDLRRFPGRVLAAVSSSCMRLPRAAPKRKSAVLIPTTEGSSRDLTSWAR
jgi:hypothetical protein